MEAIASKAKVSKATLYRWWSTKAAVVMDGFLAANEPRILFPDTGSVREDIRHQMHRVVELFASQTGRTIAALIAEGQTDPELAEAFRSRWLSIRRIEAKQVLERVSHGGNFAAI
jgi:AcrR family transcriptional regulator